MARNIEMKARLRDRDAALDTCARIAAESHGDIHQLDTYFRVPAGRLKLREADPGRTELVQYHRADEAGPKGCDYQLSACDASIKPLLAEALGTLAIVDKVRTLWLWKNVRIHLDRVQGLGDYIEFEAVLDDTYDDADGHEKLALLIQEFGIAEADHERVSYLELIQSQARDSPKI